MRGALLLGFVALLLRSSCLAQSSQAYNWKNVKIGGGGGFVPGIVFNPSEKNLAYARTDIGGAYRLNLDGTWSPLLDFADNARWNYWGVDALATDPVEPKRLYLATGMYTNSWDSNNGQILASVDYGATWTVSSLPFKVGGNMPGRGMGERLAVDPNKNSVLYFGARSGNGLWKSTNYGTTWNKVTTFTSVGTYIPDPGDGSGYKSDRVGIAWVTFDQTAGTKGSSTRRIFVGVASVGQDNVFVSEDAGVTWKSILGFDNSFMTHKGVIDPNTKVLYISANNHAGPMDGTNGAVWKYDLTTKKVTNITPPQNIIGSQSYGFGGLAVDYQKPGTVMVAALNIWWPDGNIFRSTNGGETWTTLWEWDVPRVSTKKFYTFSNALVPWLSPNHTVTTPDLKQIGWMMEALVIDPFDSNRWMYGTGATIQGGRDLLKWDTTRNITLQSMAGGIEETSVSGLISPPTGPHLLSAVHDISGFVHNNFAAPVSQMFSNPTWTSTADLDFAGANSNVIVRIGTGGSSKQLALSHDSGATWSPHPGAPDYLAGGQVSISADGTSILWRTGSGRILSGTTSSFTDVSGLPAGSIIAADRNDAKIFYGASGSTFYISRDAGRTFSSSGTFGSYSYPHKIAVHRTTSGDVWVSTNTGLFHSTNFGATFTTVSNVSRAWDIALGAASSSGRYPAVFAVANISGTGGIYRSDDAGTSWLRINDADHGFGSYDHVILTADSRRYGRVYIGTNGRGIFYGDIK